MRAERESFKSGWISVGIRLRRAEIEPLITALRNLTVDSHFHLMGNFEGEEVEPGVADIEFSLQGPNERDNLSPSYGTAVEGG